MFGPISQVVFDFDGTLVNTMPSVILGMQGAIHHVTGETHPVDELLKSFGPAPQDVLLKWVGADKIDAAFRFWINFEKELSDDTFKAFEGVDEMLQKLFAAKIKIGIFTGRDRAGTLRIAEKRGWLNKYFSANEMVCGDDGFKAKPAPDSLLALLKRTGWAPESTLMVGDHPYDVMAGKAAKVKTAAALWDLPETKATHRSRFKEGWNRWNGVDSDLRLVSPLSLSAWLSGISAKII